jgi:DNA (cytosine-5)-methyltransferase 1
LDGLALPAAGCDRAWPMDGGFGRSLFGLSLCAGAGGLDLGLHIAHAGYRTVGYVEREAYAAATLVARMEDTAMDCAPVWDDVSTFDGRPWRGLVDIVHGGYPCQPFSIAGRKLGDKDPRHLWPHVARIVREVEPRFCFFENVGGHLRLGFEQVHDDLRSMDYRVAAGLFTAEEVGASHKRERLFILAYAEGAGNHGKATDLPQAQRRQDGSMLRVADGSDSHMAHANGNGRECQQRTSAGEDDPQGRTERPAHAVSRGNGDAAEGLSLHEAGFGAGQNGTALPCGEGALANTPRARARKQRPHPRAGAETGGDPAMGDAHGAGLEGRDADQQQRADGEQPFPPGPTDKIGWERFLRERPDLEPAVRGGADGLACRVDRLRLCGNGVVPLVAAYAFRTLASAAGIEFNES